MFGKVLGIPKRLSQSHKLKQVSGISVVWHLLMRSRKYRGHLSLSQRPTCFQFFHKQFSRRIFCSQNIIRGSKLLFLTIKIIWNPTKKVNKKKSCPLTLLKAKRSSRRFILYQIFQLIAYCPCIYIWKMPFLFNLYLYQATFYCPTFFFLFELKIHLKCQIILNYYYWMCVYVASVCICSFLDFLSWFFLSFLILPKTNQAKTEECFVYTHKRIFLTSSNITVY